MKFQFFVFVSFLVRFVYILMSSVVISNNISESKRSFKVSLVSTTSLVHASNMERYFYGSSFFIPSTDKFSAKVIFILITIS